MIFLYDRLQPSWLIARYSGDPADVRSRIEAVWKRIAPDVPFEAQVSDQIVQELYDAEETRGIVFAAFAVVAILVACLGLFGLAAFVAERRTKEIGIRKVFGATVRDIVQLLAWQFSKPVILANLIAWPVAWWLMRDWLNGFDARIDLGPTPFLVAGLLALAIAVGRQTILGFEDRKDGRIDIVCSAELERIAPVHKRAHQGWRYLETGAAATTTPSPSRRPGARPTAPPAPCARTPPACATVAAPSRWQRSHGRSHRSAR